VPAAGLNLSRAPEGSRDRWMQPLGGESARDANA